jgi:pilus assembly protein CpaE
VDEYESTLGLKADVTLVSAHEVLNAVNRGEPLVRAYSNHPNSKALVRFASTLADASASTTELHAGRKSSRLRLRKG